MTEDTKADRPHYGFLDGLRGLAAIAVLLGHLNQTAGQIHRGNYGMAVDLFFILSGFVLMNAYGQRLAGGWSFGTFVRLRLIRLYPMLVVGVLAGLALTFGLFLLSGEPGLGEMGLLALTGLLCLPLFGYARTDAAFPLNPPQWSLFFEFVANFLFAALGRWMGPALAWSLTGVGAIFVVIFALDVGYTDFGSTQEDLWGGLGRVLFGFFCGAGLYMLPRLSSMGLPAGAGIVVFLTAAMWPWWDAPVEVRLALILLGMPLTIHVAASIEVGGGLERLCRFLGAISYPLYIIHTPLMGVTSRIIARIDPAGEFHPLWIAAQAALFIGLSWAFVKYYDEPLRAWLSRRLRGGPRRAAQSPGP